MAAINGAYQISGSQQRSITARGTTSSSGWKSRVAGAESWGCTITQEALGSGPEFTKGSTGTLTITLKTSHTLAATAYCSSVDVQVENEDGPPVNYVYTLVGTAALTPTGAASANPMTGKDVTLDWT